jgi:translocation and assembly module TamA
MGYSFREVPKHVSRFHLPTKYFLINVRPKRFFSIFIVILLFFADYAQGEMNFEAAIEGLEGELLKNAQMALSPPEGMIQVDQLDDLLLVLYEKEAPQKVREALKLFGYYQAQVSTSIERSAGRLRLSVKVELGEPVRIDSVRILVNGPGAQEETINEMIRKSPLQEGEVLRQDRYEEFKNTLKEKALEAGYLEADFSLHLIRLNLAENKAAIELSLETGPRFFFGEITFIPPLTYPETFLKRYLSFQPGDVFSSQKLTTSRLNFINSERFLDVVIEADQREEKDNRIPVRIRLTPSKPKRFRFGIGYDTDQGLGLIGRYRDQNFNQRGNELNSELQLSERLQGAVVDYILPGNKNLDQKTILKLGFKRELTDSYDTRSLFSQYEYTYPFSHGRMGAGYLRLLGESFEIGGQEGFSTLFIPGVRFWEHRYDDPVHPLRGYRYSLETRGSAPFLGADGFFLQLLLQGDYLVPLGKGFALLLRSQAGTTLQNEALTSLPPSLRFFAGGDNSVRGYDYQSLGPKDDTGKVIGGRHLAVGSLEIEKAFSSTWGLAVFYDVGNAFNELNQIELKQGAGLGIRLYTPVGPIRLDLAYQIGEKDPQFRIHFSLGFGL